MRVVLGWVAVIFLACSFVQPATARPLKVSTVGGWRISAETEANSAAFGFCKAASGSPRGAISFRLTRKLKWDAQIEFEGWTLAPERQFDIYLALEPEADGPIFKFAATATGEREVAAPLAPRLADNDELFVALRKWRVLTVVIDDQVSPKLEFELAGSSDALPALRRCVRQYGRPAAPARPQRSATR